MGRGAASLFLALNAAPNVRLAPSDSPLGSCRRNLNAPLTRPANRSAADRSTLALTFVGREEMKPVACERCGTVLRAAQGIHRAGEPMIHRDELGPYIQCPHCGRANRYLSAARLAETPENPSA